MWAYMSVLQLVVVPLASHRQSVLRNNSHSHVRLTAAISNPTYKITQAGATQIAKSPRRKLPLSIALVESLTFQPPAQFAVFSATAAEKKKKALRVWLRTKAGLQGKSLAQATQTCDDAGIES